jgi:leucyl-tRNA synthetase
MLAPLAPHIADELWSRLDGRKSVHLERWPVWDETLADEQVVTLAIQVDGRVRARLTIPAGTPAERIRALALSSPDVGRHLNGRQVTRVIVVPGRVVNIVTRPQV